MSTIFWSLALFIQSIILIVIVFRNIKIKFSKKTNNRYFTDTPNDLPPVVVSILTGIGNTFVDSFSSEIAFFISKGLLSAYKERNGIYLKINRLPCKEDELWEYQKIIFKELLVRFSDDTGTIIFDKISTSEDNGFIASIALRCCLNVHSELKKLGYTKIPNKNSSKDLVMMYSIFSTLTWILVCLHTATFIISPLMIISFFLVVFSYKIAQNNPRDSLTEKGLVIYNDWLEFENFLANYGRFEDRGTIDLILWKKFLVYANCFGLADKLKNEIDTDYTDEIYKSIKKYLVNLGLDMAKQTTKTIIKN